jgi:hypothetical protein
MGLFVRFAGPCWTTTLNRTKNRSRVRGCPGHGCEENNIMKTGRVTLAMVLAGAMLAASAVPTAVAKEYGDLILDRTKESTMNDIMQGEACGVCHNGKIAWEPLYCDRCHSVDAQETGAKQ